jgi:hypothetical protein
MSPTSSRTLIVCSAAQNMQTTEEGSSFVKLAKEPDMLTKLDQQ